MPQRNFEAVDCIYRWIAGRCTSNHDNPRLWNKAHVHKVMSNLFRQIQALNNRHFPDA